MPPIHTEFLTMATIALLGAISPGPDFAIVTKNAMQHSRRAGYFTALGSGTGLLVHVTYCILGLGIIIKNSLILFNTIKYIGAAYLIYLGIKALFSKMKAPSLSEASHHASHSTLGNFQAFRQGFLTNVLNPKCIVFILSIFTLLVNPSTPYWVQSIYGLELSLITGGWFLILTTLLTHPRLCDRIQKVQPVIVKCLGIFLILLGVHLFL